MDFFKHLLTRRDFVVSLLCVFFCLNRKRNSISRGINSHKHGYGAFLLPPPPKNRLNQVHLSPSTKKNPKYKFICTCALTYVHACVSMHTHTRVYTRTHVCINIFLCSKLKVLGPKCKAAEEDQTVGGITQNALCRRKTLGRC